MSRVRDKHTAPEMRVRRAAHKLGLRFRLHPKDLPGKPDLVFPKHRLALFVHGCFWHRHEGCSKAGMPKSRVSYWSEKFRENICRDGAAAKALDQLGWRVGVVWECESKDEDLLLKRIRAVVFETDS